MRVNQLLAREGERETFGSDVFKKRRMTESCETVASRKMRKGDM